MEAEALCRRSLAILKSALEPRHPAVAGTIHNLEELLQSQVKAVSVPRSL